MERNVWKNARRIGLSKTMSALTVSPPVNSAITPQQPVLHAGETKPCLFGLTTDAYQKLNAKMVTFPTQQMDPVIHASPNAPSALL